MSLVSLKRVEKIYSLGETRITALRGIDLEIQPGEFAAVWGPSGCGKSTLCNLVGLIDHPTSGAVEFMGRDCNALSDDERSELRSRSIGFIFQSFNLIPVLSAIENVMLPLQIQGGTTAQSAREAMDNLVEMDLADHAEHRPHKLSGGQQQRVAIARALITRPSLVIADEPTANLDSENAKKILDLMLRVCEKRGTAFLFSTHDQRLLNRAHRLIHLRDGSILEDRSTAGGKD